MEEVDFLYDVSYNIFCTEEFVLWVKQLDRSIRIRVDQRIRRLHLKNPGLHKRFNNLLEIKWTRGTMGSFRFYCSDQKRLILLYGGTKKSQSKDIKKAIELLKGVQNGKIRTQVYEAVL